MKMFFDMHLPQKCMAIIKTDIKEDEYKLNPNSICKCFGKHIFRCKL